MIRGDQRHGFGIALELRNTTAQALQQLAQVFDARGLYLRIALVVRRVGVELLPALQQPAVLAIHLPQALGVLRVLRGGGLEFGCDTVLLGGKLGDLFFVQGHLAHGLCVALGHGLQVELELAHALGVELDGFLGAGDLGAQRVIAALDLVEPVRLLRVILPRRFDLGVDRALFPPALFRGRSPARRAPAGCVQAPRAAR